MAPKAPKRPQIKNHYIFTRNEFSFDHLLEHRKSTWAPSKLAPLKNSACSHHTPPATHVPPARTEQHQQHIRDDILNQIKCSKTPRITWSFGHIFQTAMLVRSIFDTPRSPCALLPEDRIHSKTLVWGAKEQKLLEIHSENLNLGCQNAEFIGNPLKTWI